VPASGSVYVEPRWARMEGGLHCVSPFGKSGFTSSTSLAGSRGGTYLARGHRTGVHDSLDKIRK